MHTIDFHDSISLTGTLLDESTCIFFRIHSKVMFSKKSHKTWYGIKEMLHFSLKIYKFNISWKKKKRRWKGAGKSDARASQGQANFFDLITEAAITRYECITTHNVHNVCFE